MTRFPVALLAVAVITFICTADLGLAAQKVRELRPNGQPIVSRLLPDDDVVIIESLMPDGLPPPFGYKPTRESELKTLGSFEELAVIDEVKSQSFFVMQGEWLNTRVTGRVSQTLKTGRLGTAPGSLIEFEHQGGELEVNKVIIRTAQGVYFENSKRYLVAVRFHPDLPAWQVVMMFELDSLGRLQARKLRSGSTPDSPLDGVSLSEVAEAISKGAQ